MADSSSRPASRFRALVRRWRDDGDADALSEAAAYVLFNTLDYVADGRGERVPRFVPADAARELHTALCELIVAARGFPVPSGRPPLTRERAQQALAQLLMPEIPEGRETTVDVLQRDAIVASVVGSKLPVIELPRRSDSDDRRTVSLVDRAGRALSQGARFELLADTILPTFAAVYGWPDRPEPWDPHDLARRYRRLRARRRTERLNARLPSAIKRVGSVDSKDRHRSKGEAPEPRLEDDASAVTDAELRHTPGPRRDDKR